MRTDTFDPQKQVFDFTHIPKCGGTTFYGLLEELMDGNYVHCFPGSGWEERLPHVWGAGGHQLRDQNPISRRSKEVVRLVIMREPLQRFISFYRHILDHPKHYLAARPEVKGASAIGFAKFCESAKIMEFDNLQSRFIAGQDGNYKDLDFVLKTFQNDFDFYAPLTMIDQLGVELSRYFGKPAPKLVKRNVSKPFELPSNELEELAEIVYRNNFYDAQLYNACMDRFMTYLLHKGDTAK